jgi:hypothetical protein
MRSSISFVFIALCNALYALQSPTRTPGERLAPAQDTLSSTRSLIRSHDKPSSKSETLSELVNKRPPPHKTEQMQSFARIFAKHHKVRNLDRHTKSLDIEALQEGWTALRKEEGGYYNTRKMNNAIEDHLRTKVPEEAVLAVRYHWRKHVEATAGSRQRGRLSKGSTRYEHRRQKNLQIQRGSTIRKSTGKQPFPFEDYMTIYDIPRGLSATDLEVRSRVFRHEYAKFTQDTAAPTNALKRYLKAQNYDEKEIMLALGARSDESIRLQKLRFAQRKANGLVGSSKQMESHPLESALEVDPSIKTREIARKQRTMTFTTSPKPTNREEKIQALLDSKKDWHSSSNW